jgi:nucleoside-diphosphate-sugar epimerase
MMVSLKRFRTSSILSLVDRFCPALKMASSEPKLANVSPLGTVFLTGVTGFVGGTILSMLFQTYPDIRIKALIRQEAVARELQAVYPTLVPVIGDLSSLSLLTSTAASVDFIIHAAGDNVPALGAMIDGLASSAAAASAPSSTDKPPLPRIISLTGPRSLIDPSLPITGIARSSSCPWSDIDDEHTILNLSSERMHAGADHAIVEHSIAQSVGTILVSPGQLWGQGEGLLKKESNAARYYALVKSRGRAFIIGDGSVTWSWVSIRDLGCAVIFLMQLSAMDHFRECQRVGVNRGGYYFVQAGDLSMLERAEAVTQRLSLGSIESISVEEASKIHPFGPIMWGCGERIRADKLASLGWKSRDLNWRLLMEEAGGERA